MKWLKTKDLKNILLGVPDSWTIQMFITEPYDELSSILREPISYVIPTPKSHDVYEIRITPGRVVLMDYNSARESR